MTYINTKNDFPQGPHWAIISFSTMYIPGDERSRTNPGHGYPASNEPVVKYQAFDNEAKWKAEIEVIESQENHRKQYIAGYFTPATIERVVKIHGMG